MLAVFVAAVAPTGGGDKRNGDGEGVRKVWSEMCGWREIEEERIVSGVCIGVDNELFEY